MRQTDAADGLLMRLLKGNLAYTLFALILHVSACGVYGQQRSQPVLFRFPPPGLGEEETTLTPVYPSKPGGAVARSSIESKPVPTSPTAVPHESFSVKGVLQSVNARRVGSTAAKFAEEWWFAEIETPIRESSKVFAASVDQLIQLALQNSAQIQVHSEVPLIRETSITEADAAFDWTSFVDSLWEDTNEPVGNTLTVGGTGTRFKDNKLGVTAGIRRKNTRGADLEISQRIGHQNNNSTFFIPNDQGTSQLTVSFTQPLLRGRGRVYNTSLTVLAQIDTKVAKDEFKRQLETHLLEVVRAYWALYLERGALAQKVKLYKETQAIVDQLDRRQHIDTQRTQLVSAQAAFAERTSELVRAQAAVHNAETRLRGLLNAPDLGQAGEVEIVPVERPAVQFVPFSLPGSVETAVQHRSEVAQAIKQVKAGCVRLNMAKHEMMPALNAVTQLYVSGLRGSSDIGQAWIDQFERGGPSYSAGLQFEVPIWRRAAAARLQRRRIELRQLQGQYRNALETVKNEVEIAVREVHTAFEEMCTKGLAMEAARQEAEALWHRWKQLADVNSSPALALESLLRSQERSTEAELAYLSAQLTYNLSLMHIKRAMGILVDMQHDAAVSAASDIRAVDF